MSPESKSLMRHATETEEQTEEATLQCLTFRMGSELFGADILDVKEIIEYNHVTPVPMVPDYIRGVINLRGNVVPVVDLNFIFTGEHSGITRKSCIVLVENEEGEGENETGILVDNVNEVMELDEEEIYPPPSFGTHIKTDFIQGMGRASDTIIILLEMKKLLTFDELSRLSRIDFRSLLEESAMGGKEGE